MSDGVVYASAANDLYALDAANGDLLWRYGWRYAAMSEPAASSGVVYVGSDHDGGYYLDAVDGGSGERLWSYNTGEKLNFGPVVSGGVVYARSFGCTVHAVDAATGTPQWVHNPGGHYLLSPLVLSDGAVHVESYDDRAIYGLDAATGELLWRYQTGGEPHWPTVSEGVVYAQWSDGISDWVAAVNAATGQQLWEYRTGTTGDASTADYPPVATDGTVYVLTGGYMDAVDTASGEQRWRYDPGVPFLYPPAATGRVVYIRSEDSEGGYLDALDASTGVRKWRYEGAWSSTPAVFGDQVYVGSFGGEIHAVDAITGDRIRTYSTGTSITSLTASDEFVYVASIRGIHTIKPEH